MRESAVVKAISVYSKAMLTVLRKTVYIKNAVLWDVAPCRSCTNRRFGGTYHLHLHCGKIRERGISVSRWLQTGQPVGK
jgi:hypothetical protein